MDLLYFFLESKEEENRTKRHRYIASFIARYFITENIFFLSYIRASASGTNTHTHTHTYSVSTESQSEIMAIRLARGSDRARGKESDMTQNLLTHTHTYAHGRTLEPLKLSRRIHFVRIFSHGKALPLSFTPPFIDPFGSFSSAHRKFERM